MLKFSKFGQIRKKTRSGQQKSLSKELAVGKLNIVWETAKKTLDLVKP